MRVLAALRVFSPRSGSSVAAVHSGVVAAFYFLLAEQSPGHSNPTTPDEKLGFKPQRANQCQKRQSHWEQEGEEVQSWASLSTHQQTRY